MDNLDFSGQDSLLGFGDYTDNRTNTYSSYPSYLNPSTWPLSLDILEEDMTQESRSSEEQQSHSHSHSHSHSYPSTSRESNLGLETTTPLQTTGLGLAFAHNMNSAASLLQPAWQFSYQPAPQTYTQDNDGSTVYDGAFSGPLQSSPIEYMPVTAAGMQLPMHVSGAHNPMSQYLALGGPMDTLQTLSYHLEDTYPPVGMAYAMPMQSSLPLQTSDGFQSSVAGSSPTGSTLEVCSLSSSDNGWATVNFPHGTRSLDDYANNASHAIFNPGQTLHLRTESESSSDESYSARMGGTYEEMPFPMLSPASECGFEFVQAPHTSSTHDHTHCAVHSPDSSSSSVVSPITAVAQPLAIVTVSSSSSTSPTSTTPPLRRRKSPTSPNALAKTTKAVIKKESQATTRKSVANDKKVGRRKGPLRPEQRQQAHEIRKLRACLRCKFLKKTCDKGDPCAGCRPSHARLWQVPCTRIDIKDIGYFVKDWKVDFERHVSLGFSINNIKGFSSMERTVYITHGYGHYLPINAREVFVVDDKCFGVDWVETLNSPDSPTPFEVNTPKLSAGMEGVSSTLLSEYIDKHLEFGFNEYIDDYFEGVPFLTEMLKTAYKYSRRTQTPVVRKALKLVVAYTLTMNITMCEGLTEAEAGVSRIDDEASRYVGKTMAPVMINFQVKCALADMWRELQKDILEELSSLYSSVYQGDKLRHWPTIFMLASILLAVWEMMQFDSHYREPDEKKVEKFCNDMESTPVGVIVGLFQAISQKLPSFMEWNTEKHKDVLKGDAPICDALTEVREHVLQHGKSSTCRILHLAWPVSE